MMLVPSNVAKAQSVGPTQVLGFPYCLGQFENSNFADFWLKSCDDRMIFVEALALNYGSLSYMYLTMLHKKFQIFIRCIK